MTENKTVIPYSLADAPALIEKLFPVQKLSVESYKEQMAGIGKTLTALGSYWKGRKPLILARACILGCLLPATEDLKRDLEIFEMLMGMDDASFVVRLGHRPTIDKVLAKIRLENIHDYFIVDPIGVLPNAAPIKLTDYGTLKFTRYSGRIVIEPPQVTEEKVTPITIAWRSDVSESTKRRLEAKALDLAPYRDMVSAAKRPEEVPLEIHTHIWKDVNSHLGTKACSFPELVEQLGIMRFGHRPGVADTFSGSGQIPFEAARLGCNAYASDLNPIACMLSWGALNIVGGEESNLELLVDEQKRLIDAVEAEIQQLGVESDGKGWRGKIYLYCMEVRCPHTGWTVPLLPTRVINKVRSVIAELRPDPINKRYDILVRSNVAKKDLDAAGEGTVRAERRGDDPYLVHTVDGVEYRTKISTLRGDYRTPAGTTANRLRLWEKSDFRPHPEDIFQERLYAIQWMRPKKNGRGEEYDIRGVTTRDLENERVVDSLILENLAVWQTSGWIPNMRIEPGYNTRQPIWERGWTYWHHLFNPRQLLVNALINQHSDAQLKLGFARMLNCNSRLSRWTNGGSGAGMVTGVFDNQALNTLYNYGCRGARYALDLVESNYKNFPVPEGAVTAIGCHPADQYSESCEILVTDPPYGDAVKYEEILEFFIAWLRKNPPQEFSDWTWDSRRALAIKGNDEDFRQGMVAAYKRMAERMPDNGIQVIMFTHQDGSIWADMANIVWAAGLQVTAAWYVVTETDSALRSGSYVKGTVLLVVRKRQGNYRTTSDDLAWEIQEEVQEQVETLTGLNQEAKGFYRDDNLFEDADLQMAGYAAALRVLTRYAFIDGKEMAAEAIRPRISGEQTSVDELIDFAVAEANAHLVPNGISKDDWAKLAPAERFYLKLTELEASGLKTLDNYQNFAKAFKVIDYRSFMGSQRANLASLKSAVQLGRSEMSEGSEFYNTVLRGVLYALMELVKGVDGDEVLAHLTHNIPNYYDQTQRELAVKMAGFLAKRLETIRPEEASAARILSELVRNQRM